MKLNRRKLEIAMANACMNTEDLVAATGMPRTTVNRVIAKQSSKPGTIGKIAKALSVPVEQIIDLEN